MHCDSQPRYRSPATIRSALALARSALCQASHLKCPLASKLAMIDPDSDSDSQDDADAESVVLLAAELVVNG